MTQKEFAGLFGIPLSTLRKWEQGDASPPQYVESLIAKALPASDDSLQEIKGKEGSTFYYDKIKKCVLDSRGNSISVNENLSEVKEKNLELYITELFERFYEIQSKFERDCFFDKKEDINWI